jgi:hypothetical protein
LELRPPGSRAGALRFDDHAEARSLAFQARNSTDRFLCGIPGIWCRPVEGIAEGEVSASEAAGLAKVIRGFTQALTTFDIDKRTTELERRMKK